jgi:hypothetical protein
MEYFRNKRGQRDFAQSIAKHHQPTKHYRKRKTKTKVRKENFRPP